MKYLSTRGQSDPLTFSDAVMTGLARDGGLLLPDTFPDMSGDLKGLRGAGFNAIAFAVMRPYVDFPDDVLKSLIAKSTAVFRDPAVTPVRQFGDLRILELFHGPTLAFKDVALQFLGNLFEYILTARRGALNVVAATSGDTGSAAIHGLKGRSGIRLFVMHPKGRTSPLQALQMTTVRDSNIHNLAIDGSFDDCQSMVKCLFNDLNYRDRYQLGAVNSINWARVLAQVVYYAYASLLVSQQEGGARVRFAVPTGNFGDIFAGFVAARMGFPIKQLILATNTNDILARFFKTGEYRSSHVVSTMSPSMDIQVASNFERYLYYRVGQHGAEVLRLMEAFQQTGALTVPVNVDGAVDPLIVASSATEADTLAAIRDVYHQTGYLLDPHTAVGYHASRLYDCDTAPMVCLATAHPAKFPDAIRRAVGSDEKAHHPLLDALAGMPVRCDEMAADPDLLKEYIAKRAQ